MSVSCPQNVFDLFEPGCGGWFVPNEQGLTYCYEVLPYFQNADAIPLSFPRITKLIWGDWEKFECWCDEIKFGLLDYLIPDANEEMDFLECFPSPKDYFITKNSLKKKILEILCFDDCFGVEAVVYVEIVSDDKSLFLVYLDTDAWVLGHASGILVFRSLDELTPSNGFYTFVARNVGS
jgi:hypothetical protein